jgi:hypothetical protein
MAFPHTAETMEQRTMQMQPTSNTLWRMLKDGHAAECAMANSPIGVEAQFLIDGRMLASYQFGTPEQVVAWAVEKGTELSGRGWKMQARRTPHYLAA